MADVPAVALAFAKAVVKKDVAAAYALTTSGFQKRNSLDRFTELLEQAEEGVVPPKEFTFGTNPMDQKGLWKTLEQEGKQVPADIDPTSFERWMVIQFLPGEDNEDDLDACYDCWIMVVRDGERTKIAYMEIHDPD